MRGVFLLFIFLISINRAHSLLLPSLCTNFLIPYKTSYFKFGAYLPRDIARTINKLLENPRSKKLHKLLATKTTNYLNQALNVPAIAVEYKSMWQIVILPERPKIGRTHWLTKLAIRVDKDTNTRGKVVFNTSLALTGSAEVKRLSISLPWEELTFPYHGGVTRHEYLHWALNRITQYEVDFIRGRTNLVKPFLAGKTLPELEVQLARNVKFDRDELRKTYGGKNNFYLEEVFAYLRQALDHARIADRFLRSTDSRSLNLSLKEKTKSLRYAKMFYRASMQDVDDANEFIKVMRIVINKFLSHQFEIQSKEAQSPLMLNRKLVLIDDKTSLQYNENQIRYRYPDFKSDPSMSRKIMKEILMDALLRMSEAEKKLGELESETRSSYQTVIDRIAQMRKL